MTVQPDHHKAVGALRRLGFDADHDPHNDEPDGAYVWCEGCVCPDCLVILVIDTACKPLADEIDKLRHLIARYLMSQGVRPPADADEESLDWLDKYLHDRNVGVEMLDIAMKHRDENARLTAALDAANKEIERLTDIYNGVGKDFDRLIKEKGQLTAALDAIANLIGPPTRLQVRMATITEQDTQVLLEISRIAHMREVT